eukprot:8235796-Pyramimonas_sp.AAC.1
MLSCIATCARTSRPTLRRLSVLGAHGTRAHQIQALHQTPVMGWRKRTRIAGDFGNAKPSRQ